LELIQQNQEDELDLLKLIFYLFVFVFVLTTFKASTLDANIYIYIAIGKRVITITLEQLEYRNFIGHSQECQAIAQLTILAVSLRSNVSKHVMLEYNYH
jgi:hypothetical protein